MVLFGALSSAGLTGGMVTQQPIVLRFTVPDFLWVEKKLAVYLDGVQVHRKAHVERRDEEITELLERQGWRVLRFSYSPPLSFNRTREIVDAIKDVLGRRV
jgi:very-short-patch-repair endonuclease